MLRGAQWGVFFHLGFTPVTAGGGGGVSLSRELRNGEDSRWTTKEMMVDSLSVLSSLSSSSSLLCSSGGAVQGLPTKAFQSHRGSISSPNLLCSSVHLQLSHWSLTESSSHTQTHTLKVDNVMRKRVSSSLVFAGVLSPFPRLSLQSRWLSLVDSGKPLLSLLPRAYVESRVAT